MFVLGDKVRHMSDCRPSVGAIALLNRFGIGTLQNYSNFMRFLLYQNSCI
jgi:hypothetical protein